MDTQRIIDVLNAARARELAVIIQYMEHHYVAASLQGMPSFVEQGLGDMWVGSRGSGFAKLFGVPGAVVALKSVAKVEMLHAQSLANRVTALGGVPTVTPGDRCKGSSVREMLELDVAAEEQAIALYVADMELCRREGDEDSSALFEKILLDERSHSTVFQDLLARS
ncbi:MAG: ferritin-like domain-containing protein [Coriobacteriia bacterium]